MTHTPISIFAPAKVNLYLHVTGVLDNGYHTLDSLISFADIGDEITIEPADDFAFAINGPFAKDFSDSAMMQNQESTNLVVQAVFALMQKLEKFPDFKITLTKNLPLESGIGGGSANAAATLWGLLEWWGLQPKDLDFLPALFLELGADVPVCYYSQPARVRGIGEKIDPVPELPELDIVLVNPGIPCSTPRVFDGFSSQFSNEANIFVDALELEDFIAFLKKQRNDLTQSAFQIIPEIEAILHFLENRHGCLLSRMTGSGATCFGIFDNATAAQDAAHYIQDQQPNWWVRAGTIGRIERY